MITKKLQYLVLHILLIALFFLYYINNPAGTLDNLKMMGIFGWIQILVSIIGWKRVSGKIFVPYIIFLIAAYAFCFGQSFLEVFNLVTEKRSLLYKCSLSEIYNAQIYTLLFLSAFHVGALMSFKRTRGGMPNNKIAYAVEWMTIRKIGGIISKITALPFLIENFFNYMIVSTYGYRGLYEQTPDIPFWGLITLLSDFFIPGVLCLLLTSQPGSNTQRKIYLLFATVVLVIMYCGGRSQGVVLVAVVLLYYQNYVKPISKRGWIIILIAGFFFVSLLSAVAHLREGSRKQYLENVVNYRSETDENPLFETISEMGGSMFPMARTIDLVPMTEPYRYGSTYLYAFSSIIPNLGFWKIHPAAKNANLGDWLMAKDGLTYGPGYSIVAEAYINWGPFGFIIMFILGVYFSRLLNIDNKRDYKMLSFLIAIIFTYMSLKMVRNSFIGTVRILVFYLLPLYWYVTYNVKKSMGSATKAHY